MRFGKFNPLFESGPASTPGYLLLLHVGENTSIAIGQIKAAIEASGDRLDQQVSSMLREPNWRPQLVAATTMLVGRLVGSVSELWAALDRPCWVSPQLVATACLLDPGFLSNSRTRIENGCRLNTQEVSALSPLMRHSALGPASFDGHSSKLISALTALCLMNKSSGEWLEELTLRSEVISALHLDVDRARSITLDWYTGMKDLLGLPA